MSAKNVDITVGGNVVASAGFIRWIQGTGTTYTVAVDFQTDYITVTDNAAGSGAVATDTIFDAKGDLVVGSGADTSDNLAVSVTDGDVLTADAASTLGVKWATPSAAGDVATDVIWDAKGDIAVGSGANTADNLPVSVTDGHILTVDAASTLGVKWAAAPAGGAVAAADVTVDSTTLVGIGTNQQAVDEEFDNAIVAAQAAADNHVADAAAAHAASAVSADSTTLVGIGTDVQAVLEELDNGIADHLADAAAAHAASAVSADSTTLVGTGTDVQAVLEELDNAIVAAETVSTNHLGDAADAHDASAISVLDTATQITATDVEGALAEIVDASQAHDAAADPHTGYRLESADHTHASTGAQAGQLDHGTALTGLTDDDHTQYQLETAVQTIVSFSKEGTLTTGTGTVRWYNDTGRTLTFASTRASVGTAPTGATILIDVNKDATTIFTTQASRPTIAISGFTDQGAAPDVTTIANGSYLTVDIDQIGSTIAGADLSVQIFMTG